MSTSTDPKVAVILGAQSEIAQDIAKMLGRDGWRIEVWARGWPLPEFRYSKWDLCLVALGSVAPVGTWHGVPDAEWREGIESNLLKPISLLREIWPKHNENAVVCFLAGSNPNMVMAGYSAYNVGKMALLKAVEQLDFETPDARIFALGPGTVLTKIHRPTIEAKWPNPKLAKAFEDKPDKAKQLNAIYQMLLWCLTQPKSIIGGRNICVSDADRYGASLMPWLRGNPNAFKLRRVE